MELLYAIFAAPFVDMWEGPIFFAEAAFQGRGWTRNMPADWWGRDPQNPEIALVGVGCMPVSLLRWLVGPIAEVSAYGYRHGWTHQNHHDTVVANLRFESGAVGRILITEAAQRPYGLDLALYGDEGTLCNNRLILNRWADLGRDEFTRLPIPEIPWKPYPDPAIQGLFDAEIRAFVQAIEEGYWKTGPRGVGFAVRPSGARFGWLRPSYSSHVPG